jgi:N-acetylmuramoyl-L-alanine amidase
MPMAGYTSKRCSSLRAGSAAAALLALLTGAVSPAAASSNSPKTAAGTTGKVTSVRFWSLGDVTRISIETSTEFKFRSERLANPDRLYFDIQGARPALSEKGVHLIAVDDGLLKQIRIAESQPGVTRVVLDLIANDPAVTFTASQLSNPDRLMVELRRAGSKSDSPAVPLTGSATSGGVSAELALSSPALSIEPSIVRAANPEQVLNTLASEASAEPHAVKPQLVAKLAPRAFRPPPEDFSIPPPKPVLKRLKLDIPTPPALPTVASAKPLPLPVTGRVIFPAPDLPVAPPQLPSASKPPSSAQSQLSPLPAKSIGTGDPSLTRALGLKLGRVVIDAGHGGNDVGTHGPSGLLEKDVVLDIALKLGALLQERLGADIVYTRGDDTYVGLEQRTQIANEHKADLFLSIHANSSPYHEVGGVETYYLNFATTKSALDLAAKENAGSQRTIFDLKDVLAKIAMKDKIDESREFATSVQNSLFAFSSKNNAAAKNRGIKKAPFVVLIGASMPSVLAEIGFLTNATDEALLRKPEQREKIAEALYRGVANYADSLSHFQVAKRQ